jgi:hypothetical protein
MKLLKIRRKTDFLNRKTIMANFIKDEQNAYVTTIVTKYNEEEVGVHILFNRFKVSRLDIAKALRDKQLLKSLKRNRLVGDMSPLKMSIYEKELIYDHKHDEIFNENQNENENES